MTLTQTYPRLWSLEAGMVMVVTDLHGDWEAYCRYRDRFIDLQAHGEADWLVLTGDLIHTAQPGPHDKSLEIVLDVIKLRESYRSAIIYLCGNHELPHLYSFSLAKGNRLYTPDFEATLSHSHHRAEIMTLFDTLPFYLRSKAGVSVTHAGAFASIALPNQAPKLFHWSHQRLLAEADNVLAENDVASLRAGYAKLQQASYDDLARYYLAVSGPDDPRYNDLLRGFLATNFAEFDNLLWPALFTRCEETYGRGDYGIFLDALLQELSADFTPQTWLVAGHMTIPGGHQVVTRRHLRLASARHATPREAGQYLRFDAARPIARIESLLAGLESVYQ